jgi:hypothetical protein
MSESILSCIQAEMDYACVPETKDCWCHGSGWINTDWDTQHKCPHHFNGQPNSESPDEEWELWFNMHGDNQFLVIQDFDMQKFIDDSWVWHMRHLEYLKENEDLPF